MKFFIFVLIFITSFSFAFAYSDGTTHPGLTDEIIDLFNLNFPELKISDGHKELAKNGSTDEDKKPRSMYHFYDPIYNRGIELTGTRWQSSKDWAQDTMGQASLLDQFFAGSLNNYFSSNEDHSWDRAIYEYVWGDKERAFYDLGHILHLIEDASVPDHTRNDPHPPWFSFGSPYEAWTAQFGPEQMEGLAKSLFNSKKKPIILGDLQSYFNSIANYSNNNFFSKDTIPDKNNEYKKPEQGVIVSEILKNGIITSFVYSSNPNDFFRLALVKTDFIQNKKEYFVKDDDFLIFSDYWKRLSKQALLHGVGVMKLFFDEVEKEKQSKILYNKNKSWFAKIYDATKNKIFGIAATLYGSSLKQADLDELLNESGSVSIPTPPAPKKEESLFSNLATELLSEQPGSPVRSQETALVINPTITPPPIPPPLTVRGGGEGGSVTDFSNTEVGGSGGSFNTPRVAPENDNISGSSTSGVSSSTPDVFPPDLNFSITECSSSLSSDGCMVTNSNLLIFWSSTSTEIASFDVECAFAPSGVEKCFGFLFNATSATSTNYSLPTDEKTYQFRARARDTTGNISNWATINVEYYSSPVVINEVAWAGTSASSADEWVELFNKTGKNISLSDWTLMAQDQVPYINLSGTILANGYYLIERSTDDATISDITADLAVAFSGVGSGSGLLNSGEVLVLLRASTTIDQTVLCSGSWCGGTSSSGNLSMERVDAFVAGTDSTNWGTSNYLVTQNGKDANNTKLYATPKKRNSLNYLISQTDKLSSNKTLTKSQSPYVVPTSQDFTINTGATLTIEPGVVIKMGDQSSITVSGDIISSGTASDLITFTSIYDDSYVGDTNGDGSVNSPTPGSWKYLRIQNPSQNSQINYTRFKYGGRYFSLTALDARAMVSIYEATTTISNSIFEESKIAGLRTTRFYGQISGNTFSGGNTTNTDNTGLYVYEGMPIISGNTFSNNYQGLNIELPSSTSTISNSTFSNNYIGLYLTLAKANLDNLTFSNNTIGIQSSLSTVNIITPGSITFINNIATTSPGGLF